MQTGIPFVFMRGGTSRGPYFNRADLPEDLDVLADVLIAAVGSGHELNIDGIGGGAAVTTKVAMLSQSDDDWADIDYFFAQVSVEDRLVDYKPTCGNILSGVGPAVIEMGLITPTGDETEVRIRAVNTGAQVLARVQTLGGQLTYQGEAELDANRAFFERFEAIRIKAGEMMGMGDVTKSVTPKFGILAPAKNGGTIATRYFMPWNTHPSMAVTGAQCLASCALTPGTVSDGLLTRPAESPANVVLEHASGKIDVLVDFEANNGFSLNSAGILRTARKLAQGDVFVPATIWAP